MDANELTVVTLTFPNGSVEMRVFPTSNAEAAVEWIRTWKELQPGIEDRTEEVHAISFAEEVYVKA